MEEFKDGNIGDGSGDTTSEVVWHYPPSFYELMIFGVKNYLKDSCLFS